MSELTQCNYCSLRAMKRSAKLKGNKIVTRNSKFMGGIEIFSIPKGKKLAPWEDMIEPSANFQNGNKAFYEFHVGWMMEIPNHCCC